MYDAIIFTDITDNISAAKPIGAYKCAHSLRSNGYSCLVVDNTHSFSLEELQQLVKLTVNEKTKFVGFSNTFFADSAVEKNPDGSTPPYKFLLNGRLLPQGQAVEDQLIELLRNINPKIKIVSGGARANPNETNRNVDYVLLGYAEVSIVNLMNHLSTGEELKKSIKNVWGKIVINDRTAEGYDFANSDMIWLPEDVVNQQVLTLEVARGCIFKCKFCSFPMNGKKQLDFVRSESQLMYELEKNYNEYGIFRYFISDDTFNDNDHKLDLLLRGVKKLKFQPEFWAYVRLDLLSRDVDRNFQKLYDIGLRATQFGVETLNDVTGKIIGKGYDRRKQIEAVQHIRHKYGDKVVLHGSFIVGLPEESEESCQNTFNMLQSQEFPLHGWRFNGLALYKNDRVAWNSELSKNYQQYGYREVSVDNDTPLIMWANKHMTYTRALELAESLNQQSHNGNVMRLPSILGWSILTLGYEPSFITDSIFSQVNFNEIENKKLHFMDEYKQQLFKLLNSKVNRG